EVTRAIPAAGRARVTGRPRPPAEEQRFVPAPRHGDVCSRSDQGRAGSRAHPGAAVAMETADRRAAAAAARGPEPGPGEAPPDDRRSAAGVRAGRTPAALPAVPAGRRVQALAHDSPAAAPRCRVPVARWVAR